MALKKDLTQGSVTKHILAFTVPMFLSSLLQAFYNVVDMYFVGRYVGTSGSSAVSVSGTVLMVLIAAVMGMAMASTILIGQYQGRGDNAGIRRVSSTAMAFLGVCVVLLTALGFFVAPYILRLINTPTEAFDQANAYLKIMFGGLIFMFGYNLISAFQRGLGDSVTPLYFVGISTVTNVILDWLFIGPMQMGVPGAAYATVIAQALSFILGVMYFQMRGHVISFHPRDMRIDVGELKRMLKIGLPSSIQQTLLSVSFATFAGMINSYGLYASAAYGIGGRVDSFSFLPAQSISIAVTSVVSQNLGAKLYDRALKAVRVAVLITLAINTTLAFLVYFNAASLVSIFNTDTEVIREGVRYMHIIPFSFISFAVFMPCNGMVQGSGGTMYAMFTSLCSQYLVRIPLALVFSRIWGIDGVYYAMICGPLVGALSAGFYVISGRWKKHDLIKTDA